MIKVMYKQLNDVLPFTYLDYLHFIYMAFVFSCRSDMDLFTRSSSLFLPPSNSFLISLALTVSLRVVPFFCMLLKMK